MNVHSPHKWWSTLKSAAFGSNSSLPAFVSEGGVVVCESVGKADLLSDHFDSNQSREAVDLPLTCHPSPSLTTFLPAATSDTLPTTSLNITSLFPFSLVSLKYHNATHIKPPPQKHFTDLSLLYLIRQHSRTLKTPIFRDWGVFTLPSPLSLT